MLHQIERADLSFTCAETRLPRNTTDSQGGAFDCWPAKLSGMMTFRLGRGKIIMGGSDEGGGSEGFTPIQTAQLLLDEWKFRQTHCWRLLQRFGLAAIVVSIAPYASADLIPAWRPYLPWLAWFGWGLELFVAWVFAAEYTRCYRRGQAYDTLLRENWPGATDMLRGWKLYEKPFAPRIGWVTVGAIIVISTVILWANLYVLGHSPLVAVAT